MWSRQLSEEEGLAYSDCMNYTTLPAGDLVSADTAEWNITGSLIRQVELQPEEVSCDDRLLIIPVKACQQYRSFVERNGPCFFL